MCARFGLSVPKEDLERFLGLELPFEVPPAYNIAPTENTVALLTHEGHHEARWLRWGLVPYWADSLSIGSRMINARSETAMEKGAFKQAFEKRRCIIPASGFFEWKDEYPQEDLFGEAKKGKPVKQPLLFKPTSGSLFGFAGLWERWRSKDRESTVETFTILTGGPNTLMAPIHDRMPVIIQPRHFDLWLSEVPAHDVLHLMVPVEDTAMTISRVTPRMNNPRYKEPDAMVAV